MIPVRMSRAAYPLLVTLLSAQAMSFGQATQPTTKPASTTATAPSTAPATAPATHPAAPRRTEGKHPAVQAAIAELTKEIEQAVRSGGDEPRTQSDYFKDHPTPDLLPQSILTALRRPIGPDPRAAAYVKWQLLSGLPDELDAKAAADLLQIYRTAPPPFPRPGLDKQERDELDRLARNGKQDEEEGLAERFNQRVETAEKNNRFILQYRSALLAKLPPSYESIGAGFEDSIVRMNAGVDAAEHTREVCKSVPLWAAAAPPDQLRAMSRAVAQLRKKKGPEYYDRIAWSARSRKLEWKKDEASLSSCKQLGEVEETLEDKIKNPSEPLKLKEER